MDEPQTSVLPAPTASLPPLHRGNRGYISLFIDAGSRFAIAYFVIQASPHAPCRPVPAAVLFIELDPADVDVNIHPTKAEVRFNEPGRVFSAVQRAVRRTLVDRPSRSGSSQQAFGQNAGFGSAGRPSAAARCSKRRARCRRPRRTSRCP